MNYVFTLLILAHNEEKFLEDTVLKYVDKFETILIVDDKSTDQTGLIINKLATNYQNIKTISNKKNLGPGASMSIGIDYFLSSDSEYLIKIDGDNQFKEKDVIRLRKLAEDKNIDFIKGDRFWENGIEGKIPLIRYFGNAFASFLLKISSGNWNLNDPLNGLFLFSKRSLKDFQMPKLFKRYGYPFFISTYMTNLSIEKNLGILQIKNTISYENQKSNLNAFIMFFKLVYFAFKSFLKKISLKLKYSNLQVSAILDIFGVFSFSISVFCLLRFLMIRYGNLVGSQANWFIVFLIFFLIFIYLIYQSQKLEHDYKLTYFSEA